MRDLSGRRQRDINNERRLKDYIAGQVGKVYNAIFLFFFCRAATQSIMKKLFTTGGKGQRCRREKGSKTGEIEKNCGWRE